MEDRWAWAFVPIVLILALHSSQISGFFLSFGFVVQILFGVWMARRFGWQGLAAFAVGCALASVKISYTFIEEARGIIDRSRVSIGNPATDNAIAWLFAWLAADRERSPIGSMVERSGIIRQWALFWPLLAFGMLAMSVFFHPGESEAGLSFSFRIFGLYLLATLASLLGLAGAGRQLFSALLLVLAVVLLGNQVIMFACYEDQLTGWLCEPLSHMYEVGLMVRIDPSMTLQKVFPILAGLVSAFAVGHYARRLDSGENESIALLTAPAKTGFVLLVIGIGFGPYSAIPLADRFSLYLAGSPTMMMAGAFLLGARLGMPGIVLAACGYLGTVLVPDLIELSPRFEPLDVELSTGPLLDCMFAAAIGTGIRDHRRAPQDAPRRFETMALFAAVFTLLLGLVDASSQDGAIWLIATPLIAALVVLAIRFREERARAAGHAVTLLTDIVLVWAVLVFLRQHVPGVLEAFGDVIEAANNLGTGEEASVFQIAMLGTRNIPIVTVFFFLFLLLLFNVSVLYRRVLRMVRELPKLLRMIQFRLRSAGGQSPPAAPADDAAEHRGNE